MQATDREAFEEQFAALCAGFNVPCTLPRRHAYFLGLAKMSLQQFARVVERCLADNGPEEMPTVSAMWRLHRERRLAQAVAENPQKSPTQSTSCTSQIGCCSCICGTVRGLHRRESSSLRRGWKIALHRLNFSAVETSSATS